MFIVFTEKWLLMKSDESRLHRKALHLSIFTVGYNVMEGIISIFAGFLAGSVALVGFGLDSFIESSRVESN